MLRSRVVVSFVVVLTCSAIGVACGGGDGGSDTDTGADAPAADTDGGAVDVGGERDAGASSCGGDADVTFDGAAASPGDDCGECDGGLLVCDGPDALRCVGGGANLCGGCTILAGVPDTPCGVCGGSWVCDGPDAVLCEEDESPNACGGCGELDGEPAWRCSAEGEDGTWTCDAPNAVACIVGGRNACGGEDALDGRPGSPCGACGLGRSVCETSDALMCDESDAAENACGGCSPLPAAPGASCGDCGTWTCDESDPERLVCVQDRNACGGCEDLEGDPGGPCGDAGDGAFYCDGTDKVTCGATDVNACGGGAALGAEPGTPCGECGDGVVQCVDGAATVCVGATPPNACDGCGLLPGVPGDPCGPGAEWVCGDDGVLSCEIPEPLNDCGGTDELLYEGETAELLTVCGACGVGRLVCASENTVVCIGDPGADFLRTLHVDADLDGFGDPDNTVIACLESEGVVDNASDCDDGNAGVNPDADEVPGDGFDQNCDGDERCFIDNDQDGARSESSSVTDNFACDSPGQADADADLDCDDEDPNTYPGGDEIVGNAADNNCDGIEHCPVDADGDRAYDPEAFTENDDFRCGEALICGRIPECGDVTTCLDTYPLCLISPDCDEMDDSIYIGAEELDDGIDQNCDGNAIELGLFDEDRDGYTADYGALDDPTPDCAPFDPRFNPGTPELCLDGFDNDCDSMEDEAECVIACDGFTECYAECDETDVVCFEACLSDTACDLCAGGPFSECAPECEGQRSRLAGCAVDVACGEDDLGCLLDQGCETEAEQWYTCVIQSEGDPDGGLTGCRDALLECAGGIGAPSSPIALTNAMRDGRVTTPLSVGSPGAVHSLSIGPDGAFDGFYMRFPGNTPDETAGLFFRMNPADLPGFDDTPRVDLTLWGEVQDPQFLLEYNVLIESFEIVDNRIEITAAEFTERPGVGGAEIASEALLTDPDSVNAVESRWLYVEDVTFVSDAVELPDGAGIRIDVDVDPGRAGGVPLVVPQRFRRIVEPYQRCTFRLAVPVVRQNGEAWLQMTDYLQFRPLECPSIVETDGTCELPASGGFDEPLYGLLIGRHAPGFACGGELGMCGNDFCDRERGECDSCPTDCGAEPACDSDPVCGDGRCELARGECSSCPDDCSSSADQCFRPSGVDVWSLTTPGAGTVNVSFETPPLLGGGASMPPRVEVRVASCDVPDDAVCADSATVGDGPLFIAIGNEGEPYEIRVSHTP